MSNIGPRFRDKYVGGMRELGGVIIGACSESDTPDLWFIDDMAGRTGNLPQADYKARAKEVNVALAICGSCDKKVECLEEGMRPENLSHGIWGGLMAGERLLLSGEKPGDHSAKMPQSLALNFLSRLGPYLRR